MSSPKSSIKRFSTRVAFALSLIVLAIAFACTNNSKAKEKPRYTFKEGGGKPGIIAEIPRDEMLRMIKELEAQMKAAARDLEFEKAALLRDQIIELRRITIVDPVLS